MGDDTIMTEQERNARPFGEIVKEALLRPLCEFLSLPLSELNADAHRQ